MAKTQLQRKLETFNEICNQLDLAINLEKINTVHFNNRKKKPLDICLHSTPLNQVNSIKYLGRFINKNNSANLHVNEIVDKTRKRCDFLKTLSGCTFGVRPAKALQLYKTIARSKLEHKDTIYT